MFKKPSGRQQLAQRIIVAILAIITVGVGVTALILFIMGYRIESGSLEQGALLQFESKPTGATVYIDGKAISSRTNTKSTVLEGQHTFSVTRDGYDDWNRTITVQAGTLTWLDYVRLVPSERTSQTVLEFETLDSALAEPGGEYYVLQTDDSQPSFILVDLRSEKIVSSELILPDDIYSTSEDKAAEHKFTVVEWDEAGRYILVRHELTGGDSEWLVVDTHDVNNTRNLTKTLGSKFKQVAFIGTDNESLYGLTTDGILRKLDLGSETMSRALVSGVDSFTINRETKIISYVGVSTDDSGVRTAGLYRDGDENSHVIASSESDSRIMIASGKYHSYDYVAVADGQSILVYRGTYPSSSASQDEQSSLEIAEQIDYQGDIKLLSFSSDASYLIAQYADSAVSYEVEHDRVTLSELATDAGTMQWLDGAYTWYVSDGNLMMRDFDGSNQYSIMVAQAGYDVTLSRNGRFVYSIGKTENGQMTLQRVKMILD